MTEHKCRVFTFSDVEVREQEHNLRRAGEVLPVEPNAFSVLLYLLGNPGRLIPKGELLNGVWGDTAVTENSLTRSVSLLRRLLEDDARVPRYIETVSTVGYRFVCPVEVIDGATDKPDAQVQPAATSSGRARRWGWLTLGAATLAALLAIGFWYLRRPLPAPRITDYVRLTRDGKHKEVVGTDGSRLYLNLLDPRGIAQVPISGGQITRIPVDLLADEPSGGVPGGAGDVSPDGSSLLVRSHWDGVGMAEVEVSIVGIMGHPARFLTKAFDAAWSPDGKSVAYSTAHGDIYLIPSAGGEPRLLLSSPAPAGETLVTRNLSWSPDGSTIRFTRDNELWEVSSSGANLHQLLPGWHTSFMKCCGRWTPDGEFFLFLSGNTLQYGALFSPGTQLWAIDERRGRLRPPIAQPIQLTSGPIVWGTPIPSRDGQRIFAQGVTIRGELVRYDRQSNQLQPYLEGISAEFVAFSRDGKYVAYVSFPDGILWRANRDGTGLAQLSDPPFHPKLLRWSPDGSQILFTDNAKGVGTIYVVPAQGGAPTRVLPEGGGSQGDAYWSPDGKEVVYGSQSFFSAGPQGKRELRVLDLASHKITILPGSEGMASPRWSPDGRYIAALTSTHDLTVFDLQSQRWTTIQKRFVNWPTWSHDSRSIYFLGPSGIRTVFRIPVKGGKSELVVDLKGFHHMGWFAAWMGLDPSDAPLLLRDVGTDEIYALTLERK